MDAEHFDALARQWISRRTAVPILGGVAAGLLGWLGFGATATAKKGKGKGKKKGKGKSKGKKKKKGQPGPIRPGFSVSGRSILDPSGNPVVLRGVNIMSVFADDDPTGTVSFPEIKKTGANTVRIVWGITTDLQPNGPATNPANLDALIANARANGLVPMIELHDATGLWGRLNDLVAYWTRPGIIDIIKKHQGYLLVNIGNEVGDHTVTDDQFRSGYTQAVQQLRRAGIHTPLVIDAPEFGKKLTTLTNTAASLLSADPDHNLIFSVHLYWSIAGGANAQFIRDALQSAVAANYPLIVGEFSRFGAFPQGGGSICTGGGETDFRTMIEQCQQLSIGWYAWEWGPGNGVFDPACAVMDMTPNRQFANLKDGWAKEVVTTSPFSIKNTSRSIL